MSKTAAERFLDRVEEDPGFRAELEVVQDDHDAVYRHVLDAGFDVEPAEVMEAFTERFGVELTPEQLEAIAAGDDTTDVIIGAGTGVVIGAGIVAGLCAAF